MDFKVQNTTSTMLRMLIPVNRPSVPPKRVKYYHTLKVVWYEN